MGQPSPAANASASRWPARFSPTPALLILDEPTAHLDPDARQALTTDLLQATQGRTLLFITHHPDGLDQFDHIVVLDRGRVAEQGTHHQLRHAGGPYQRIWDCDHKPISWPDRDRRRLRRPVRP